MKRLPVLVLVFVLLTKVVFAQTILSRKEATFMGYGGVATTTTYGDFYKGLMDFFLDNKATPKISLLLGQLDPYLNRPLSDLDRYSINKLLDILENETETDPKTGERASILKTRVSLGSFVENLRTEVRKSEVIENGDTTVADGTEVMPDTVAREALDGFLVSPNKSDDSPWIWWIISGVSVLAVVGIGYLYLDEKKKREQIGHQMLNTASQASQSYIKMQQLEKQVPQLIEKAREYEKALNEYKKALEDKDKDLRESKQNAEKDSTRWSQEVQKLQLALTASRNKRKTHDNNENKNVSSTLPPKKDIPLRSSAAITSMKYIDTFYLSVPNKDGSFRDIRRYQFDPTQSLYRVSVIDAYTADFEFIDQPIIVQEALKHIDRFIDPVCKYADIHFSAHHIETLVQGKLIKVNSESDRWELQHKAIIRFKS